MAKKKKIKKPVYIPKEERRKKNPMPKKTKIIIASVCGVLALALILFVLLFDDGSLPVKKGVLQIGGDNWLVTNLNKQNRYRYYKQAEVNAPEGFVNDPDSTLKSDQNETSFWFNPENEDNPVKSFYITGNAQRASELVESVQSSFISFYGPESVSEVQIGPVGGNIGQYFTTYTENEVYEEETAETTETEQDEIVPEEIPADTESDPSVEEGLDALATDEPSDADETIPDEGSEPAEDEEPADPATEESSDEDETLPDEITEDEELPAEPEPKIERTMQLVAYFPAQRNSSIVFVMNVRVEEGEERPTLEELLELAEPLASCIDIYVPNAKPQ